MHTKLIEPLVERGRLKAFEGQQIVIPRGADVFRGRARVHRAVLELKVEKAKAMKAGQPQLEAVGQMRSYS